MLTLVIKGIISLSLIAAFLKRKNVHHALVLLILTMPFARIMQWGLGWSSLSKVWFNIVFCFLITAFFLRLMVDTHYSRSIKFNKLDLLVMIFMLHGLLNIYITYQNYSLFTAVNGFRTFFFGGVIYFVYRGYIRTKKDMNNIASLLVMATVIIGVEVVMEFLLVNLLGLSPIVFPWLSGEARGVLIDDPTRLVIAGGLYRPLGLLAYVHYTGYVIALGILLVAPFAFIVKKYRQDRFFNTGVFALLFTCLVFSTSRSIIVLVILLLLFLLFRYKISKKTLYGFFALICIILVIVYSLGFLGYLEQIFSSENPYYRAFRAEDPFENIADADPLKIILGRGVEAGKYQQHFLGEYKKRKEGFRFNQISDEFHFFHYLDRLGLIGGALLLLQVFIAYKICMKGTRLEKDLHYKKLLAGLSLCPLLYLLSSVHILHGDVIMQFFTYSIFGIIGSYPQIYLKNKLKEES